MAFFYENVFHHIDDKVLNLLRDPNNKVRLLIWFPSEGFHLSMPRFLDDITWSINDKGIPFEKVVMVYGDLKIEKNYERPFFDKFLRNFLSKVLPNTNYFKLSSYLVKFGKMFQFIFPKKIQKFMKNSINFQNLLLKAREKGIKIGLGSASKNAKLVLSKLDIEDFFETIIDGTMVKNSKPDPEVFLKGAQGLSVQNEHCIVFEDSQAGILAARGANMKVVAIGNDLKNYEVIGFDTETKPTFVKGPLNPPSIMQLACDDKVYIFQFDNVEILILKTPFWIKLNYLINLYYSIISLPIFLLKIHFTIASALATCKTLIFAPSSAKNFNF